MTQNPPVPPELQQMAGQALILPSQGPAKRHWKCLTCGNEPPTITQTFNNGMTLLVPAAQATQLSSESGAIYLCLVCMVRWQRENVPALVEVDADGNPLEPPPPMPTPLETRPSRAVRRERRRK